MIEVLDASDKMQKCLGLKRLPHSSTLKYFADRSDTLAIVDAMLAEIVGQVVKQSGEQEVAIDATGVSSWILVTTKRWRKNCWRNRAQWSNLAHCLRMPVMTPNGFMRIVETIGESAVGSHLPGIGLMVGQMVNTDRK